MKNFTYKNLFIKSQIERKIIMNQKYNIYSTNYWKFVVSSKIGYNICNHL